MSSRKWVVAFAAFLLCLPAVCRSEMPMEKAQEPPVAFVGKALVVEAGNELWDRQEVEVNVSITPTNPPRIEFMRKTDNSDQPGAVVPMGRILTLLELAYSADAKNFANGKSNSANFHNFVLDHKSVDKDPKYTRTCGIVHMRNCLSIAIGKEIAHVRDVKKFEDISSEVSERLKVVEYCSTAYLNKVSLVISGNWAIGEEAGGGSVPVGGAKLSQASKEEKHHLLAWYYFMHRNRLEACTLLLSQMEAENAAGQPDSGKNLKASTRTDLERKATESALILAATNDDVFRQLALEFLVLQAQARARLTGGDNSSSLIPESQMAKLLAALRKGIETDRTKRIAPEGLSEKDNGRYDELLKVVDTRIDQERTAATAMAQDEAKEAAKVARLDFENEKKGAIEAAVNDANLKAATEKATALSNASNKAKMDLDAAVKAEQAKSSEIKTKLDSYKKNLCLIVEESQLWNNEETWKAVKSAVEKLQAEGAPFEDRQLLIVAARGERLHIPEAGKIAEWSAIRDGVDLDRCLSGFAASPRIVLGNLPVDQTHFLLIGPAEHAGSLSAAIPVIGKKLLDANVRFDALQVLGRLEKRDRHLAQLCRTAGGQHLTFALEASADNTLSDDLCNTIQQIWRGR